MTQGRRNYTAEYREEAVRLVLESSRSVAAVARELGVNEGTLGNWVNRYRREHADDEHRWRSMNALGCGNLRSKAVTYEWRMSS